MTIPSTARRAGPYQGSGVFTSFPFTFKVFSTSDIKVTIVNSLDVETILVLNVDYTVTLNSNQETSPGGSITYPISGSPLPVGSKLTIVGNLPYDQPLDLPSGGNFSPLALENQLDRMTMQIQQLREQLNRTLTVPVTTPFAPVLPAPEASNLIGWNENGTNLHNYPIDELATALAFATFRYDTFTGNGVTTQFTLSADPITLGNLDVAVAGVTQVPGTDYTLLNNAILQFTSAPSAGVTILARFGEGVASGPATDSYDVRYLPAGLGAVQRTAESKLRETVSVLDFGASPTAAASVNRAAIQAALDAMTNGTTLDFVGGVYNVDAPLVVPPNLTGCVFLGKGATIQCNHNGDGLVMIAANENFSRHKVYDLTIKGPNVSYPNNPSELAGTSTGAALKMGYDDTSNTVAGYLTSFYNCTFSNFHKGVYLQATILVNFYGGYISFNQYGVYIDGGQTNANTFYGVGIRENRQFGVYSSGRTGGSLSAATHNVFHSCEIETNIPYDSSAGGYPSSFDPNTGIGIKIWESYDFIFDSCYMENHNYSVLIETSSDDNKFISCRFDGGGPGGVRPGSVVISGPNCNNNAFINCKMSDYIGYTDGTFQNLSSTNLLNQLINSVGFSFNPTYVLEWPYIQNLRKSQGVAGNGQQFGAVVIPAQGILSNPGPGTGQGQIDGIGTAAATLNAFGYSHFLLGNQITGDTTITAISNMRPGQFLVITNYQTAFSVSITSATTGTGSIQLQNLRSIRMNQFGQSITLFCNVLGHIVEVGRNFSNAVKGSSTITDANTSVAVTFASAGYADEPDSSYEVFLTPSPSLAANPSDSYLGYVASKTTTGFTISSKAAPGVGESTIWYWQVIR